MNKTRIIESQIIEALKEHESGTSTEIICREYGISIATLYLWKKKYSEVDLSQLKRLKELEEKESPA